MKHLNLFVLVLFCSFSSLVSAEKLADKYLVSYGKEEARIKVVQYFSFMCPYCLELYRREFEKVKLQYIEQGTISYTFHPVPKDLLTVCAMLCLEKLNGVKRKAFLEVMLSEVDLDNIDYSIAMMKKAMEVLESPIPRLHEKDYLETTSAFKDAFAFVKGQGNSINNVPTSEINGRLFPEDIPDLEFLKKKIDEIQIRGEK